MLVRGMVRHKIKDETHTARMERVYEPFEILHGPEHRINGAEVGDIIAKVQHRRTVNRREPDGVDTEPFQVVEAANETG